MALSVLVLVLTMADGGILLEENFGRIAVHVDGWKLHPCLDGWDVIEVIAATLLIGFALGYMCAVKCGGPRIKVGPKIIMKSTSTKGTHAEPSCRTVGAQSPCTYKRNLVTPRFHSLPESADGVFDVSFSA